MKGSPLICSRSAISQGMWIALLRASASQSRGSCSTQRTYGATFNLAWLNQCPTSCIPFVSPADFCTVPPIPRQFLLLLLLLLRECEWDFLSGWLFTLFTIYESQASFLLAAHSLLYSAYSCKEKLERLPIQVLTWDDLVPIGRQRMTLKILVLFPISKAEPAVRWWRKATGLWTFCFCWFS